MNSTKRILLLLFLKYEALMLVAICLLMVVSWRQRGGISFETFFSLFLILQICIASGLFFSWLRVKPKDS